jgi:hypothetical protein
MTKNQYVVQLFIEGKTINEIYNIVQLEKSEIEQVIRVAMRRRCGWNSTDHNRLANAG